MAIGDPPSPDYDIKDGKRQLGDTSEAEYPPSLLYIKDKKEFKQVGLGLNCPTNPIRHPGGEHLDFYSDKNEGKESFLKVAIPPVAEDLSVFLIRNPSTQSWRKAPVAKVYKNGLESFPLNSARVMNFSRVPLKLDIGGKILDLSAQNTVLVPLQRSEQGILSYRIVAVSNGQMFMLANTATTYPADCRLNFAVYEADGKDKRQPVKIVTYYELPYRDPSKETKEGTPDATGDSSTTR